MSTEITFPATSFLQDPFIKEGQDPIMDDNGVIKTNFSRRQTCPNIMINNGSSQWDKVQKKSCTVCFPATSYLQDPFIKDGQDPILDDNGVIKSNFGTRRQTCPNIMRSQWANNIPGKSTRPPKSRDMPKSEEQYQKKYGAYEIERKKINQLRSAQQDKICNIVFFLCVILVSLLIIVYAYVYLVLIHKVI